MGYQYRKHYTRDEAQALLPQVRQWLRKAQELHQAVGKLDNRLTQLLQPGNDVGGESVHTWLQAYAARKKVLQEFTRREIIVKDVNRGLVDFPTLRGEREVFLCWEQDEDHIEFWHELDAGYAGRERI